MLLTDRALGRLKRLHRKHFQKKYDIQSWGYHADGFAARDTTMDFLKAEPFRSAWKFSEDLNVEFWPAGVPDIRWRAHVCCWAAEHALRLSGDYVECGVFGGLLSLTVCKYIHIDDTSKTFWLFDTFEGLPVEDLPIEEKERALEINKKRYFDCFELAKKNFSSFQQARLVRGILPDSLRHSQIDQIAYLSMDLNSASAERKTIEQLWPKLVVGGMVVLDDYAQIGSREQYDMWNQFAASNGRTILTLPSGQGLLIR